MENHILENQLLEAWYLNNKITTFQLEHIPEEIWNYSPSKRGGGAISYQYTHIYNIRYWKAEALNKKLIEGFSTIKKEEIKGKEETYLLLNQSADFIAKLFRSGIENDGIIKGYKGGLIQLFMAMINHEAHHRGSIMAAVKHSGTKIPDELKYNIWDIQKLKKDDPSFNWNFFD